MHITTHTVSLNGRLGPWTVPEPARLAGLTHQFTPEGEYLGSTWTVTGQPFRAPRAGCPACSRSGVCGCVIGGQQITCEARVGGGESGGA